MNPKLEAAHRKLTEQVMDRPGVTGTAVTERGGEHCLVVYLETKEAGRGIPRKVEGFKVVMEVTGGIQAF